MSPRSLLIVVCFSLSACVDDTIERHRDAVVERASSCGEVSYGGQCPANSAAAVACLQTALAACTPAHLQVVFVTDEGARVVHDYLVERTDDGGCELLVYEDDRADSWAADPGLTVSRCAGATFAGPTADGCEIVACAPRV